MTNIDVVENKISQVEKYLFILEDYKKYTQNEIEDDVKIRGGLERYLYLVCQSAIDLADAFISFRQYRKPGTLRESFYILNEVGIIDNELCKKMADMAGLRNLIAHDYGKIDYSHVYKIIHDDIKDVEHFIKIIQSN